MEAFIGVAYSFSVDTGKTFESSTNMIASLQEISIEFIELPPYEQLEQQWLALEKRSDCSFFTSWSWIGCWLSCLPLHIKPRLLRATRGNEVVGLGLVVFRNFWRHRLFSVKGLFLNATGDPSIDDITIEYNGFLVDRTLHSVLIPRLCEYLSTMNAERDELYFDGVSEFTGHQLQNLVGVRVRCQKECFHYVDLDKVRLSGGDYLSLLGNSTRYNIRRSIKEFAKLGPVTLIPANHVDEAIDFFLGLKKLHQAYWQSKGLPGAFANSFFESFHKMLISTRFNNGEIQLIKTKAGERTIGYLYNFVHLGQVHNYQTGFDYTLCKRQYSPGLVTHSLAIEYNTSQGHHVYDLMAGDSQYKQALSTHAGNLYWIVLQRNRIKFRFENGLRLLKNRVRVKTMA